MSPLELRTVVPARAPLGLIHGEDLALSAVDVWNDHLALRVPSVGGVCRCGDFYDAWSVHDDAGTVYEVGSVGSSGLAAHEEDDFRVREMNVEVRPAPPSQATWLTVAAHDDDGRRAAVTVPLDRTTAMTERPTTRWSDNPNGATADRPRLDDVLPVAADLGVVGDARMWLLAVDMWNQATVLRLAYCAVAGGEEITRTRPTWTVTDDLGTQYDLRGGGGTGIVPLNWRLRFAPAPPATATTLTVTGTLYSHTIARLDIPLARGRHLAG